MASNFSAISNISWFYNADGTSHQPIDQWVGWAEAAEVDVDLTTESPTESTAAAAKEYFEMAVAAAVQRQCDKDLLMTKVELDEQKCLYDKQQSHMEEMQWQLAALLKQQHSTDGNGDDISSLIRYMRCGIYYEAVDPWQPLAAVSEGQHRNISETTYDPISENVPNAGSSGDEQHKMISYANQDSTLVDVP